MDVERIVEKLRQFTAELIDEDNAEKKKNKYLPAFRLLQDMPGHVKAGAVFVLDKDDSIHGNIYYGCLKLAWYKGGCQSVGGGWGGDTFFMPGQVSLDQNWFIKIDNSEGYYDTSSNRR